MKQKWTWDAQTLKDNRFVEIRAGELRKGLLVYMPGMPPGVLIDTIPPPFDNVQALSTWRLHAYDSEHTLSLMDDALVTIWIGDYADAWALWMRTFP